MQYYRYFGTQRRLQGKECCTPIACFFYAHQVGSLVDTLTSSPLQDIVCLSEEIWYLEKVRSRVRSLGSSVAYQYCAMACLTCELVCTWIFWLSLVSCQSLLRIVLQQPKCYIYNRESCFPCIKSIQRWTLMLYDRRLWRTNLLRLDMCHYLISQQIYFRSLFRRREWSLYVISWTYIHVYAPT